MSLEQHSQADMQMKKTLLLNDGQTTNDLLSNKLCYIHGLLWENNPAFQICENILEVSSGHTNVVW